MRSIWSGSISLGLVNIPVNLLSAVTATGIDFNLVHKEDLCPINYARVCRRTGKEIPYDEIVRAFEVKKDQYIILEESDFEAANVKKYNSIEIISFLETDKVEKIYYEKPYYLKPQKGAERAYYLFMKVLKQAKKSAIGKFVLRNREHLVVIEPNSKELILYQLRFDQEIKKPDFKIKEFNLEKKEIDLATTLVKNLSEPIKIKDFRDTYTDELLKIIERKSNGEKIEAPEKIHQEQIPDLVRALEESLKNLPRENGTRKISKKKKSRAVGRAGS